MILFHEMLNKKMFSMNTQNFLLKINSWEVNDERGFISSEH